MSSGTSPTLTPISVLRASGLLANYDGADDFDLGSAVRSAAGARSAPPRSLSRSLPSRSQPLPPPSFVTGGSATPHRRVAQSAPLEFSVDIGGLTPRQEATHSVVHHMLQQLRGRPQLDGLLTPTAAQMDMYAPLKTYMESVLCPVASGVLTLRSVISIIVHMPAFSTASEAVVGAALIALKFHDPDTWTSDLTNKLDKWLVRASFWDVHVPHPTLYRVVEDDFHKRLILAAKELALGRVCISGHGFLLPIMREYAAALQTAGAPTVQKRAVDCVLAAFGSRACLALLHQTRFADALDGYSIPLPTTSLRPDAWSTALKAYVADRDAKEMAPHERAGSLGEAVITAAKPYCWMLVATQHMTAPVSTKAEAWETAMIAWDPMH